MLCTLRSVISFLIFKALKVNEDSANNLTCGRNQIHSGDLKSCEQTLQELRICLLKTWNLPSLFKFPFQYSVTFLFRNGKVYKFSMS